MKQENDPVLVMIREIRRNFINAVNGTPVNNWMDKLEAAYLDSKQPSDGGEFERVTKEFAPANKYDRWIDVLGYIKSLITAHNADMAALRAELTPTPSDGGEFERVAMNEEWYNNEQKPDEFGRVLWKMALVDVTIEAGRKLLEAHNADRVADKQRIADFDTALSASLARENAYRETVVKQEQRIAELEEQNLNMMALFRDFYELEFNRDECWEIIKKYGGDA